MGAENHRQITVPTTESQVKGHFPADNDLDEPYL
jgi:hypothetical protein